LIYSLTLPGFSFKAVYQSCAERTENSRLRAGLIAEWPRVSERAERYGVAAATPAFQDLEVQPSVNVTDAELGDLYDRVLVRGGERVVYEVIRRRGRYGRCPYCGQRDVGTLDHYLPQGGFPEFSVLPSNLIPCCRDCNHEKLEHIPSTNFDQLFHPYFDDWSGLEILKAEIRISSTVDVTFRINVDALPPEISGRATTQFNQLKLGTLYANQATVELVQRREVFQKTFATGGRDALESELRREHQSRRQPFPNAWEPVLYLALAEDEQFCNGGWESIDKPQILI
jgi:hypothetical protein